MRLSLLAVLVLLLITGCDGVCMSGEARNANGSWSLDWFEVLQGGCRGQVSGSEPELNFTNDIVNLSYDDGYAASDPEQENVSLVIELYND